MNKKLIKLKLNTILKYIFYEKETGIKKQLN